MKKLLLLLTVFGGFISMNAQGSCATALPITANGVVTAPAITGSYFLACDQANGELTTTTPAGLWYQFTATGNGVVVISSSLPQNVAPFSDDTRLSVFTGTCAALVCEAGQDDVSGADYLSTVTFSAISGTTYYIQWDNRWSALGFDFDFNFTAASCLPVTTVNGITNINTTTITLNWAAATGSPAEYEVQYGLSGFTLGAGTTVTTTTNTANLTGLAVGAGYDYYIRSKCGAADFSSWTAVNSFATARLMPYTSGLDTNAELLGWSTLTNGPGGQGWNSTGTAGQAATPGYWIYASSITTANNNWLFSPAFSLAQGEVVSITFYTRATTSARTLRVTVGNATTTAAQTTQLAALNVAAGTVWDLVSTVSTFTAPAAGIYYFGFNDNSAATAAAVNMRLDTFNFTSVLSNNEFLASNLSVYPNPTKNIINISNSLNAVVESVVLTDLNGRVVKSQKINATEGQVNISDLATGIYMMNVTTDQGTATKKIVKE